MQGFPPHLPLTLLSDQWKIQVDHGECHWLLKKINQVITQIVAAVPEIMSLVFCLRDILTLLCDYLLIRELYHL